MTTETTGSAVRQWATTRYRDDLRLVPPLAEEFTIYGGEDTVKRARQWALEWHYLLAVGVPACAHGLYLMRSCPGPDGCRNYCRQLDHVCLWVPAPVLGGGRPFLLAHPYAKEIAGETRAYARAHGLEAEPDCPGDDWYGRGTLPIRMSVPPNWPLWPIEAAAAASLTAEPVAWPGDSGGGRAASDL